MLSITRRITPRAIQVCAKGTDVVRSGRLTRSSINPSCMHGRHCSTVSHRHAPEPVSPPSSTPSAPTSPPLSPSTSALLSGILSGDRLALSRAFTLIESRLPTHQTQATLLLEALARARREKLHKNREDRRRMKDLESPVVEKVCDAIQSGSEVELDEETLRRPRPIRIGISGPPGVGKSSFIEAFGSYLVSLGHSLAVLSIDPSSHLSGGSILGDKTRMGNLSRHERAYVRPSPSKCVLGGVGANTFDSILLCEYAGYDIIIVETVGVGQSEVSVADMVDFVMLLAQPGGGDELQGMKKGIMELIDLVVINKADGKLLAAARRAKLEFMHVLQLNTRRKKMTDWKPKAKLCSSVVELSGKAHDSENGATSREDPHAAAHPTESSHSSHTASASASSSLSSSTPSSSPSPIPHLSPLESQRAQLRSIWSNIVSFSMWSHSSLGDFMDRRKKQFDAMLEQSMAEKTLERMKREVIRLDSYKRIKQRAERGVQVSMEEVDGVSSSSTTITAAPGPALVDGSDAELIPRVAAQRIVDEWLGGKRSDNTSMQ